VLTLVWQDIGSPLRHRTMPASRAASLPRGPPGPRALQWPRILPHYRSSSRAV